MKKTISILASLAISAAAQATTPGDLTLIGEFNGSRYYISPDVKTWYDCNSLATSMGAGAHLAIINSQAENDYLQGITASGPNAYGTNGIDCWIGLYQDKTAADYSEPAGGWRWVDGSTLTYSNWHPLEPNDGGSEDHGHFNRYPGGLWNDHSAGNLKRALIEVEGPVLPQLTTLCYWQGPTRTGGVVAANRSDINNALSAQNSDVPGPINFFSLGYSGWALFSTDRPILNGPGTDVTVVETTWGNPYPAGERARVLASQDGINYVDLGMAVFNGSFDLGSLSWARYFMVVDVTPLENSEDAFDLDGLTFTTFGAPGLYPTPDPSMGNALVEYIGGTQGKQKSGANVPSIRSNPSRGLGLPQLNDTYNFYSLGFGGTAIYRFAYGVINLPGADIRVTETSFGSPSCTRYPEHVKVDISYDGSNWIEKGTLCLDGTIDVAPHSGATYIRFTDVSDRTKHSSSADGWDLDGAVNLSSAPNSGGTSPCSISGTRLSMDDLADQNNVPDELQALQVYNGTAVFSLPADQATIRITDRMGRVVATEQVSGKIWDSVEYNLPVLSSGVYMISVETPVSRDVLKFVK